jgi:hypothetical protein
MEKSLLIESGVVVRLDRQSFTESVSMKEKSGGRLIVRGIPATKLEFKNANGRKYSKAEMQKSLDSAKALIESRGALCTADDHPSGTHVAPIKASHVLVDAYIRDTKDGPYLFNDWEILETANGKDLRALVDADISFGTSIRGLGNMQEDNVVNYEYLGTDAVGNPSSGTFTKTTEDLGVKVTVECVTESSDANLISTPLEESTSMTTPALAIDQAKTRVNAFIESNSNDINGLTALIVSEEVKLVTEASVTTQDMAPWNEFKESVFGKVPAPVVESAPKDNLTEAQLRDKLTVADRRLLASEAVAEDLRNKLNESNESHKVLVSEAAATTTLLEGALARLRESRAAANWRPSRRGSHGSRTVPSWGRGSSRKDCPTRR